MTVGWWCGDGMQTRALGRKYDLIDVGRAERHHVRADRHSGSTVSTPQCSCKQAIQHVPTASTPPLSRSWASCRSPRARSSSPPGPREESPRGISKSRRGSNTLPIGYTDAGVPEGTCFLRHLGYVADPMRKSSFGQPRRRDRRTEVSEEQDVAHSLQKWQQIA